MRAARDQALSLVERTGLPNGPDGPALLSRLSIDRRSVPVAGKRQRS
nr:MAG TPA: hypothetical protein [Caudoviricetes sp.]